MKRIFVGLTCAAIAVLGLAGCKGKEQKNTETNADSVQTLRIDSIRRTLLAQNECFAFQSGNGREVNFWSKSFTDSVSAPDILLINIAGSPDTLTMERVKDNAAGPLTYRNGETQLKNFEFSDGALLSFDLAQTGEVTNFVHVSPSILTLKTSTGEEVHVELTSVAGKAVAILHESKLAAADTLEQTQAWAKGADYAKANVKLHCQGDVCKLTTPKGSAKTEEVSEKTVSPK